MSASPVSDAAVLPQDGLRGIPLVMAAISMYIGMACSNLDLAIVQNALPAMSAQMHITSSDSVWIITLYMLVTLTLLLPFARLSDRIGYRRFFLAGLVIFVFASLGSGLSSTLWQLQVGRVFQGIGSAAMMCSTTSLTPVVYPRALMARAIGTNATVIAVSFAAAPSLSALILLHLSWHCLFLINVPLGCIAFLFGAKSLPIDPDRLPAPITRVAALMWGKAFSAIDWLSVGLNIAFFTLLLLGTEAVGVDPLQGLGMLLLAAILGTLFVRRQIVDPEPMLPFDLLRQRHYAFTIATSFASFAAQGAAFVSLPFYLQRSLGFDAADTALILTAWPLALAVSAQVASRLSDRVQVQYLCATGQGMMALSLGLIASHLVPANMMTLVCVLALSGAGFGLFQAPNNYVIIASAPPGRSGSVAALRAATRTSGQLMGSALCGLAFLVARHVGWFDGATLGLAIAAGLAFWASFFSLNRKTVRAV